MEEGGVKKVVMYSMRHGHCIHTALVIPEAKKCMTSYTTSLQQCSPAMLMHPSSTSTCTHCQHVHELCDLANGFSARGAARPNEKEGACQGRVLQRGTNHIEEVGEGGAPSTLHVVETLHCSSNTHCSNRDNTRVPTSTLPKRGPIWAQHNTQKQARPL